MKTAIVWIMISFLPGQQCQNVQFPTQQACEQFAHQVDYGYQQADPSAHRVPSKCVKSDIVVKSDEGHVFYRHGSDGHWTAFDSHGRQLKLD